MEEEEKSSGIERQKKCREKEAQIFRTKRDVAGTKRWRRACRKRKNWKKQEEIVKLAYQF